MQHTRLFSIKLENIVDEAPGNHMQPGTVVMQYVQLQYRMTENIGGSLNLVDW